MIHCYYDESGDSYLALADGKCEAYVNQVIGTQKCNPSYRNNIFVTNFLVIDFLRLAIKEGKLKKEDIEFHDKNHEVILSDDNGHLDHWPEGFGDIRMNVLLKIM